MLANSKKKPYTFPEKIGEIYNGRVRRGICISTGLVMLLCRISLQFCCEFIDSNKSNILFIHNISRFIKLPTSILCIFHSVFTVWSLIEEYKNPESKKEKEAAKIIGRSANLANDIIEVLMRLKVIHFFAGGNPGIISHIGLTSTILFLFISQPISCYYSYKKYRDNKNPNESAKYRKAVIMSTLTLSLGLLHFILNRIDPIIVSLDLGNGVILNTTLSILVGLMYMAMLLVSQIDRFYNADPSSMLDYTSHAHENGVPNGGIPNGHYDL